MKRLLFISIFIIVAGIIGTIFSSAKVSNDVRPVSIVATTTSPIITLKLLKDSYRRGIHTISGAVVVPNPCYVVNARTSLIPSTTPTVIRLDLSVPEYTGRCLELTATTTFITKQKAEKRATITTYLNGVLTATSTIK